MNAPLVVVGSGLAGWNLAREFRKLDKDRALVVVSRDGGGFYSKPMLSNAIAGKKTAATLIMKSAAQMAAELNATVHAHGEVEAIDTAARTLRLLRSAAPQGQEPTETIAYGDLVLALGADPIRLPLGGDAAAEVLSVNDVDDYARFAERLEGARRVALLGAGLIGCEFANDLLARGIEPTVFDIADRPLGRLLPEAAAAWMRHRLEAAGVRFRFGAAVQSVERTAQGLRLTLADGSHVDAEVVLSAVGLRPRIGLAQAAGLAVGRGIVVDRRLATSAPQVHAIGDCAEVQGLSLPFVLPLMAQARALAANLAGQATDLVYPAMPVTVKTPASPTVVCPPPPGLAGAWKTEADEAGCAALFHDESGALRGFVVMGAATAQKQGLAARVPALLG
ncbi:MAG: FAD-dependent oxidoreductase [Burkholderiales bacterium]|nr:FAD-dependent oxidoreductase [Burkholderiales bacterium]MDE1927275.1 FAD-dependent oxidoreductase [Burkholderiales bacterium]MDE2158215.1 FAD-dependent oxidoreductase [Burkholderiales bacterium]MDE2505524.1 FAD-dependent oxidoreductase [Burkholderiales bacterium]